MNPSIAIWCDLIEQGDRSVDIIECASGTCVRDGGNGVGAGCRIVDGDLLVTDGIVIGVGTICH